LLYFHQDLTRAKYNESLLNINSDLITNNIILHLKKIMNKTFLKNISTKDDNNDALAESISVIGHYFYMFRHLFLEQSQSK